MVKKRNIIKYPLMTEKNERLVEIENKLVFIVDKNATKDTIKKAIEDLFDEPVTKVNTLIDQKGRKKAFIKLKKEDAAGDIAMKLGII